MTSLILNLVVLLVAAEAVLAYRAPLYQVNQIIYNEEDLFGTCANTCKTGTVPPNSELKKGDHGCNLGVFNCRLKYKGSIKWYGRCDFCSCDCYKWNLNAGGWISKYRNKRVRRHEMLKGVDLLPSAIAEENEE